MTGELFTVNAINVARAAIRAAERSIPLDAPVELRPVEQEGRLVVRVTGRGGDVHDVPVDEAGIQAWHRGEEINVERLVSGMAQEIRKHADEMPMT